MIFKQSLRRIALVAFILVFCTIIAACTTDPGSIPAPTSVAVPSATTDTGNIPTPTPVATPSACRVNQLSLAYVAKQEGAANRADEFSVQNSANAPCMLTGYPQIQIINDVQEQIKLQVTTATSGYFYQQIPEQPVTLQAGAKAYFIIGWAAGTCSARAAYQGTTLQFGLTGDTSTLTTSMNQGAEGGPLYCGDHLELTVSPFATTNVFAQN